MSSRAAPRRWVGTTTTIRSPSQWAPAVFFRRVDTRTSTSGEKGVAGSGIEVMASRYGRAVTAAVRERVRPYSPASSRLP